MTRQRSTQKNMVFLSIIGTVFLFMAGCTQKTDKLPVNPNVLLNQSKDITLLDTSGKVFQLKDHQGQVVLLFFGYLSCPDVCPTTLSKLVRVYKLLGNNQQKVLTAFISVDPQRDTPARIKQYLDFFGINAVGLTGSKEQIDAVVRAYFVYYAKVDVKSFAEYEINHSNYIYLIDGEGIVRSILHDSDKPEEIASQIKRYI